jgi:hypothetical protein
MHVDGLRRIDPGPSGSDKWQLYQRTRRDFLDNIRQEEFRRKKLERELKDLKSSARLGYKKSYKRAASKCRAFCSAMQTKLPRELRNKVYRAMSDGVLCYNVRRSGNGRDYLMTESKKDVSSCVQPDPRGEGRWFNKDFVGISTLREIVEMWWEESMFEISYLIKEEVHAFLTSDLWGIGVLGSSHVRHVVIHILHVPYSSTELDHQFRWPDWKPLDRQLCRSDLKPNGDPEDVREVGPSRDLKYWTDNVRITYVLDEQQYDQWGQKKLIDKTVPEILKRLTGIAHIAKGVELVCLFGSEFRHCFVIEAGEKNTEITKKGWQLIEDSQKGTSSPAEICSIMIRRWCLGGGYWEPDRALSARDLVRLFGKLAVRQCKRPF